VLWLVLEPFFLDPGFKIGLISLPFESFFAAVLLGRITEAITLFPYEFVTL